MRKTLGSQEIATIQTTAIDQSSGQIRLTTLLAHSSGEWISSDWPGCAIADASAPHRMGAALTYAQRHALFALVGMAGDDDLDAPDLTPAANEAEGRSKNLDRRSRTVVRPATLDEKSSARLRDELLAELHQLSGNEQLASWAHRRIPLKNTLSEQDSKTIEALYDSYHHDRTGHLPPSVANAGANN